MRSRVGLFLALLVVAANAASAQAVCSGSGGGANIEGRLTGLSGAFRTYDFNGIESSLIGNPITTSPAATGLAFQSARFGSPAAEIYSSFPNTFVDGAIYNYGFGQQPNTSFSVLFNTSTRGAAFNLAASAGRTIVTALSRTAPNTYTELSRIDVNLPAVSSESRTCWWGFEFRDGRAFDMLTVRSEPELGSPLAFGIDNLQVWQPTTTVPEPATVGLTLLGLAVIAAKLRVGQRNRGNGLD